MKAPTEFRLLAYGPVKLDRPVTGAPFTFTRAHAEQAAAWFANIGRTLAIDYQHQTFGESERPDGLAPAAGWIGALETRGDGLWASNVKWTERAAAMIAAGEFKYFSPVLFWPKGRYGQTLIGLGPVGLTNDPAMNGVPALVAGKDTSERTLCAARLIAENDIGGGEAQPIPQPSGDGSSGAGKSRRKDEIMDKIKQALGLPADAGEEQILAAIGQLKGKGDEPKAMMARLATGLELGEVADEAAFIAAGRGKLKPQPDAALLARIGELESGNKALLARAQRTEFDALLASREHSGKVPPAQVETFFGIFQRSRTEFDAVLATIPAKVGSTSVFAGDRGSAAPADDWEKNAELRSEFGGDKKKYEAFKNAEAAGLVKV